MLQRLEEKMQAAEGLKFERRFAAHNASLKGLSDEMHKQVHRVNNVDGRMEDWRQKLEDADRKQYVDIEQSVQKVSVNLREMTTLVEDTLRKQSQCLARMELDKEERLLFEEGAAARIRSLEGIAISGKDAHPLLSVFEEQIGDVDSKVERVLQVSSEVYARIEIQKKQIEGLDSMVQQLTTQGMRENSFSSMEECLGKLGDFERRLSAFQNEMRSLRQVADIVPRVGELLGQLSDLGPEVTSQESAIKQLCDEQNQLDKAEQILRIERDLNKLAHTSREHGDAVLSMLESIRYLQRKTDSIIRDPTQAVNQEFENMDLVMMQPSDQSESFNSLPHLEVRCHEVTEKVELLEFEVEELRKELRGTPRVLLGDSAPSDSKALVAVSKQLVDFLNATREDEVAESKAYQGVLTRMAELCNKIEDVDTAVAAMVRADTKRAGEKGCVSTTVAQQLDELKARVTKCERAAEEGHFSSPVAQQLDELKVRVTKCECVGKEGCVSSAVARQLHKLEARVKECESAGKEGCDSLAVSHQLDEFTARIAECERLICVCTNVWSEIK